MRFSGGIHRYSQTISHQGVLFAFSSRALPAVPDDFHIGYSVLALNQEDVNDDDSWSDFEVLDLPHELRPVGMDVVQVDFGTDRIAAPGAPFQVVSDGRAIFLFRQSAAGSLYADRYVFDQAVGKLAPAWEVRYRRSRKPDIPAGRGDTFGHTDMDGNTFVQPTIDLTFVHGLTGGEFAVLILPTELQGIERWQILAVNSTTAKLDSFSIVRADDGLFDTTDAIDPATRSVLPNASFSLTCGDAALAFAGGPAAVLYNRQERLKDGYGRAQLLKKQARVLVAIPTGTDGKVAAVDFAVGKDGRLAQVAQTLPVAPPPVDTSLTFDGSTGSTAVLPRLSAGPVSAVSVEAWVNPLGFGPGDATIVRSSASETLPVTLTIAGAQPQLTVTAGGRTTTVAGPVLDTRTWTHLAGTFDGTTALIYVNGQPYADSGQAPTAAPPEQGYTVGSDFTGALNEIRIWTTARSRADILGCMGTRLTSSDPNWDDLAGYWPMDSPDDATRYTTIPNLASSGKAADGTLDGAWWSPSTVPVGASMTPVAWDSRGLDVATALLDFASTTDAPSLLAGSDGLIHLYLRAMNGAVFTAARLDTVTGRAHLTVPWQAADAMDSANDQSGTVRFISRQTGTSMNYRGGAALPIEIVTDAVDSTLCTVTLRSSSGMTEVWPKVPRLVESFVAVIDGDAIQVTIDPSARERGVVMYDYTAITVTPGGGQTGPAPGPGTGSGIFTVLPDALPDNGVAALVQPVDGQSNLPAFVRAGQDCRWLPAPPRAAVLLNGSDGFVQIKTTEQMADYEGVLNVGRNFTVEAWVRPSALTAEKRATLVIFNNPDADIQYVVGLDPSGKPFAANKHLAHVADNALALNQWSHLAAVYQTDFGIRLSGTRYLDAGKPVDFVTPDAVTIESWVKLDVTGSRQTIAAKVSAEGGSWRIYVGDDDKPRFEVTTDNGTGTSTVTVTSGTALTAGTWHHLAGVYDVAFKREGAVEFVWSSAKTNTFATVPALNEPLTGAMTIAMWVMRKEPPPIIDENGNRTPRVLDTQMLMQSASGDDPVNLALSLQKNVPTFAMDTAAVSTSVQAPDLLPVDQWTHVAASFDGTGTVALYLDGIQVASRGPAAVTKTVEATAVSASGPVAYTVGGVLNTATYNGYLNQVSLWNRALPLGEIRQHIAQPLTGGERGLVGYWPFGDRFGTTAMDLAGSSSGTLVNGASFITVDKGAFVHKLVVDGRRVASTKVLDPPHEAEDAPLRLGSAHLSDYLRGTIDDVRLWKVGRLDWEVDEFRMRDVPKDAAGLVAAWPLDTGGGAVAFDVKGQNDAVIRDSSLRLSADDLDRMWVTTYFKAGWRLFVDGVAATTRSYNLPVGFGDAQMTVGGMTVGHGVGTFYAGAFTELRLWSVMRTPEEIRDNLYRPLIGTETGLAGYWPSSAGSGQLLGDLTGRGNNGDTGDPGVWIDSEAPVGPEAPGVQLVPGGSTPLQPQTVANTPGAAEYSDLQTNSAGDLIGVLKRSYAFVQSAAFNLESSYRIGDLDVQFVGQVQTRPTLTGYIEGAPPVPGENLTVESPTTPYNYLAASRVELLDSGSTTLIYTASRNTGFDMSIDTKLGFAAEQKIEAGLIVSALMFGFISKIGVHAVFEHSLGWHDAASVTQQMSYTKGKTVELFGAWAPNTYKIDGGAGRIYVPNNMGFALVMSGTSDLYALRVKGTGTLVSYAAMPNPDIPQDTNVIMFKLNPQYVKNGTLDGWIGYQPDKSYGELLPGERRSYFDPLEAYALKALVEREHKQLLAYYDQFDAGSVGRRSNAIQFQEGDVGAGANDIGNILIGEGARVAISDEEWRRRMARRSLVSTYVWNSDGGLYVEENQFAATREDSTGGSYDFVGKAGLYTELSMSLGLDFALDALFGGHVRTVAMKSKQETVGFGISSTALGEGFLNRRSDPQPPIAPGQYPVHYDSEPAPGKVNQYRFMTFYLAPKRRNFEEFFSGIVDPDWLNRQGPYAGTYDPDAFALKQAVANPNEVWRVLHRVTYVNRVREDGEGQGTESLAPDVRRPDAASIAANAQLIVDVPLTPTDPHPGATVSAEVDALLAVLEENPFWGKRLAAAHAQVRADVIAYMTSYWAITE
jgi:hypothetical protein